MEKKVREYEEITHEFDLTREEIAKKADEAAQLNDDLNCLNAEFERIKKSQKGTIEHTNGQLQSVLECIKKKKESRPITCEVIKDFEKGIIQYFYENPISNQRELVKERDMNAWERQMHLDDIKKKEGILKVVDERLDEKMKDMSAINLEAEPPIEHKQTAVDPGNFPGDVD